MKRQIFKTYYWVIVYFCLIVVAVTLCKIFIGEYPLNVSEAILYVYRNNSFLVNAVTGAVAVIFFAVHPAFIAGWLLKKQGQKISDQKYLPRSNRQVRLYFATLITACFLMNALPTYVCHNALCDYVPLVASFPGMLVGIPLAQGVDSLMTGMGGWLANFDYRPLVIVPNGILLWLGVFYFLTPKRNLPKLLRKRWLVVLALVVITMISIGLVLVDARKNFFRLSDNKLRELVNKNLPAEAPGDNFEFLVGDVIVMRPRGERQNLVAKLAGTNLAHTDIYCGDGKIINADGANLAGSGGINIERWHWNPRSIRGSLPISIVMRHPDPAVGEQLCAKLKEVEASDETTFGLDLLGKRKTFNCSNIVLYQLDPEVEYFNLVTPDLLFVYMLEHNWELVNWSN